MSNSYFKKIILGCFLLNLTTSILVANNTVPGIIDVNAQINSTDHKIWITYSVSDNEEKEVEIRVQVLDRDQKVVTAEDWKMTGDIGYPVAIGSDKRIEITYPETVKSINDYQFRVIADDLYRVDIQQLVDEVDVQNLRNNMEYLYGERSHRKKAIQHLNLARDTIFNSFKYCGLEANRQQVNITKGEFQASIRNMLGKPPKASSEADIVFELVNIVAEHEGNENPAKTFLVGAHYDSADKSPGADDNASGVVGMLEMARILSKYNFKNSVEFVAFDMEEAGLIGSWMYVLKNHAKGEKIEGLVNLDMISCAYDKPNTQVIPEGFEALYPEVCQMIAENEYRGDFIISTTNGVSAQLSTEFVANANQYVPGFTAVSLDIEKQPLEVRAESDHIPFWRTDTKAIFIGDGGVTRNPYLNSSKDVISLVNYEFMANVVKTSLATIAELAEITHSSVAVVKLAATEEN